MAYEEEIVEKKHVTEKVIKKSPEPKKEKEAPLDPPIKTKNPKKANTQAKISETPEILDAEFEETESDSDAIQIENDDDVIEPEIVGVGADENIEEKEKNRQYIEKEKNRLNKAATSKATKKTPPVNTKPEIENKEVAEHEETNEETEEETDEERYYRLKPDFIAGKEATPDDLKFYANYLESLNPMNKIREYSKIDAAKAAKKGAQVKKDAADRRKAKEAKEKK